MRVLTHTATGASGRTRPPCSGWLGGRWSSALRARHLGYRAGQRL